MRPPPPPACFEAPDADGIGRIVVDRPDDRVNALDPALIEALGAAVRQARSQPGLKGLLLVSGKADQFIAGADLKLLTGGGASAGAAAAAGAAPEPAQL